MSYTGLPYLGKPHEWIARDGLPAQIVGDPTRSRGPGHGGLPSAETDDGLQLYTNLFVTMGNGPHYFTNEVRATPMVYDEWCSASNRGMVPAHPDGKAMWRPCIYRMHLEATEHGEGIMCWERQGSQRELYWRHGLHDAILIYERWPDQPLQRHAEQALADMREDRERQMAERQLDSFLTDSQAYEWGIGRQFRCFGGLTGNSYLVEAGNGFAIVDRLTNTPTVSYCYHPECFMFDASVALSTKLHLENPDLEEDFLSGANMNFRKPKRRPSADQLKVLRYAADMERELIA